MAIEIIKSIDGKDIKIDHDEVNSLTERIKLEPIGQNKSIWVEPQVPQARHGDDGEGL